MTLAETQHIPLASAWLCSDCDTVTNQSAACPCCASAHLHPLASFLDRKLEEKEDEDRN
jgi:hypothetical protein